MPSNITRVAIFYDGNFLLHSSNYYFYTHDIRKRISLGGLQNYFKKRVSELTGSDARLTKIAQSHYFRGRLNAFDASTRGSQLYNDRVFDDILMSEGIMAHYLPLRNVAGKKEETGTTVGLSIEALQTVERHHADVLVLVISDADFLPLIRKLKEYDVLTIVAGWDFEYTTEDGSRVTTKTSQDLRNLADYSLMLSEEFNKGLEEYDETIENIFI